NDRYQDCAAPTLLASRCGSSKVTGLSASKVTTRKLVQHHHSLSMSGLSSMARLGGGISSPHTPIWAARLTAIRSRHARSFRTANGRAARRHQRDRICQAAFAHAENAEERLDQMTIGGAMGKNEPRELSQREGTCRSALPGPLVEAVLILSR